MEGLGERLTSVADDLGFFTVKNMRDNLRAFKPYGLTYSPSPLMDSLRHEVTFQFDKGYLSELKVNFIGNQYGLYLDGGRKPGGKRVPLPALIAWAQRRPVIWTNQQTGRQYTPEQVAWIARNKIFAKGIAPRNFIRPSIQNGLEFAKQQLGTAILDNAVNQTFTAIQRKAKR